MMLAEKLRAIAYNAINTRIEEENQSILQAMNAAAEKGERYVIYPSTKLSNSFLVYLEKQGLRLFGRLNDKEAWTHVYTTDDVLPTYNEFMITW